MLFWRFIGTFWPGQPLTLDGALARVHAQTSGLFGASSSVSTVLTGSSFGLRYFAGSAHSQRLYVVSALLNFLFLAAGTLSSATAHEVIMKYTPKVTHGIVDCIFVQAGRLVLPWLVPSLAVLAMLCEVIFASAVNLLLLFLVACEAFFYASPILLLAAISAVIVYEVLNAYRGRRYAAVEHAKMLRKLALEQAATNKRSLDFMQDIGHLLLADRPRDYHLLRGLRDLSEPWLALLSRDAEFLSAFLDKSRAMSARARQQDQRDLDVLFTALADSVEPFIVDPMAKQRDLLFEDIYELAGILVNYAFPLSCLQHLSRPFRKTAFLPFLLTYPGTLLCRRLCRPPQPVEFDLQHPVVGPVWSKALVVVVAAQQAGLPPDRVGLYVRAQTSAVPARVAAVKAERLSHQAILDAVLAWKARKNDELKRRFKRE
ncbi:hypothetical protein JCM10213_005582 [Rhodosporidiobolus nylandii]